MSTTTIKESHHGKTFSDKVIICEPDVTLTSCTFLPSVLAFKGHCINCQRQFYVGDKLISSTMGGRTRSLCTFEDSKNRTPLPDDFYGDNEITTVYI